MGSFFDAIILGIVQGLTEFLPISSSAHLRIVGEFLPAAQDPGAGGIAVSRNADGTEDIRPMTDEERSEMDGKWSPVDR